MGTEFEGLSVAITGGAGGIGTATACAFLNSGAEVILIDVDEERLAQAKHDLQGGNRLITHCSAIATPAECATALSAGKRAIYALVHLAGVVLPDHLHPDQHEAWDRSIAINLTTCYDMCVAFRRQARLGTMPSRVVITSSMVYRTGGSSTAIAYAASKSGLVGVTRSLSRNWAPAVLVNAIAPGVIETGMTEEMRKSRTDELIRNIPLQRFGKPSEVASVIHFLCGPGSTFITGQVINIDGGQVNS